MRTVGMVLVLSFTLLVLSLAGCTGPAPAQPPTRNSTTPIQFPVKSAEPTQVTAVLLSVDEPADNSVVTVSPVRVSGRTSPDAELTIDDQVIGVDDQGSFAAMVDLEEGPNAIDLVVMGVSGAEVRRTLMLMYVP
jgi:hypothetical protein